MICRHVQNPIKAWKREGQKGHADAQISKPVAVLKGSTTIATKEGLETETTTQKTELFLQRNSLRPFQLAQKDIQSPVYGNQFISIFFCSAGTIAEKLANKLHRWLKSLVKDSTDLQLRHRVEPLNSLNASDLIVGNILLLIASSTGEGEIPANGLALPRLCENVIANRLMDRTKGFRFAIFGNGDSRYSATYNSSAIKINHHLTQVGGYPLAVGVFQADTALEPLPFSALKSWLTRLQPRIIDQPIQRLAIKPPTDDKHKAVLVKVKPIPEFSQKFEDFQDRLLSTLGKASLVRASSGIRKGKNRSFLATFDVDDEQFEEMSCMQILPSNAPSKVNQALRSLCVESSDRVDLGLDEKEPTYLSFLTDYVDLTLPFSDVECLEAVGPASYRGLTAASAASMRKLSVQEILGRLHNSIEQMSDGQRRVFVRDMCQGMPLLHTRTYSIASSKHYRASRDRASVSAGREVDVMVKVLPGGRFSDTFVRESALPAPLRYRTIDSPSGAIIRANHLRPFVVVATGAGFGPVRCLLQWRIAVARDALAAGRPGSRWGSGISLFLGLKPPDVGLTVDVLNEAMALNLVDLLDVVLSNPMKRRVYDGVRRSRRHLRAKLVRGEGMAFVCTNRAAAEATRSAFEDVLGGCVEKMLGERYVQEVF